MKVSEVTATGLVALVLIVFIFTPSIDLLPIQPEIDDSETLALMVAAAADAPKPPMNLPVLEQQLVEQKTSAEEPKQAEIIIKIKKKIPKKQIAHKVTDAKDHTIETPTITTQVGDHLSVEVPSTPLTNQSSDDLMAKYRSMVMSEIVRRKSYPKFSKRLREEGLVTVKFTIIPDGKVTLLTLTKSSGFTRLDQASLEIFESANMQMPPFFKDMPEQPLTFELPIRYTLTNTAAE